MYIIYNIYIYIKWKISTCRILEGAQMIPIHGTLGTRSHAKKHRSAWHLLLPWWLEASQIHCFPTAEFLGFLVSPAFRIHHDIHPSLSNSRCTVRPRSIANLEKLVELGEAPPPPG